MYYLPYFIPIISLIGLVYLGYRYINLFFKINKLENEFSSIVNHTFRTPLTRILWLSKELEENLTPENRLSHVQDITNAAERILGIVDVVAGIKKISDISRYTFKAVSLRKIIEESIEKNRYKIKEKGIFIKIIPFKNIPLIVIDLKKISFVINALFENAVLYTPNGGLITISCEINRKDITLQIKDTGFGLTLIDKLRIFSRFYRNKRAVLANTDGMGLCLYLTKKIIKRHHGKIYVQSDGVDKGSTFFIKFPLRNKS